MNRETVKTFILIVLVSISFLLSYILWSYQPNYDLFYDASYVNEANVGGGERTKNELIEPQEVIFHWNEELLGFLRPSDKQALYNDVATWGLYDTQLTEADGRPEKKDYVEFIFTDPIPTELLLSLFTFHESLEIPNWSFERMFILLNEAEQTLEVRILSLDQQYQLKATIEKSGAYQTLSRYGEDHPLLQKYIATGSQEKPVYLPKEAVQLTSKTLVAGRIEPDSFINALFRNPSLVKSNIREAYFTDGQRGMRIFQEGRTLEYINPIQSEDETVDEIGLIDRSINHINEHRGWLNQYLLAKLNPSIGKISYQLHYEGFPVFDHYGMSMIEQEWRGQELYQYRRPLIYIGNLLSSYEVELPSGAELIEVLTETDTYDLEKIRNIRVGYLLNYLDEAHSLTLEPSWFIFYEGEWVRINLDDLRTSDEGIRGS